MKRRRKTVLTLVVASVILLVLWVVVLGGGVSIWGSFFNSMMARRGRQSRVALLCETDHQVLFESCMELSKRAAQGSLKPGKYLVRGGDRSSEASSFPRAILDLGPSYIHIDENNTGRVMVAMRGGLDHFGVQAYPDDYKDRFDSKRGDRELLPGLWYYDDNYKRYPNYDKKVDTMLQGKPREP
jgi:hypothetical protein